MKLTAKQLAAQVLLAGVAIHCMLFGGSRSGKTFLLVRNIIFRALKAPGSRHCILRFRFNHVKSSIIFDTFPKVMALCFPDIPRGPGGWVLSKSDWYVTLPNGSEIWFGGLDDKERTEKILGNEYATIYLCECSQISWASRNIVVTRLAQLVMQLIKDTPAQPLKPRIYYDCNPPNKNHWTYLLFVKKLDPDTKKPLANADDFVCFQMNPEDNIENLTPEYIKTLQGLSPRMQKRFLRGEFADANPNQLISEDTIEKWRVLDGKLPDFVRIVVGVDPSGAGDKDNADNDAIGIVVGGLGTDGVAYILEDCTVKAGPATWGKVATGAYDRHEADVVVGEKNFGGAMVQFVIQTARPKTPYKDVHASRGKHIRAEPIAALYENGKVRHVGIFQELEDELSSFSTVGYLGDSSPNRADAAFWVVTELFPAVIQKAAGPKPVANPVPIVSHYARR